MTVFKVICIPTKCKLVSFVTLVITYRSLSSFSGLLQDAEDGKYSGINQGLILQVQSIPVVAACERMCQTSS